MIIFKLYGSSEEQLVIDALYELRERKKEAYKIVTADPRTAGFTEADFGIPQITQLIERFEAAQEIDA